MRYLSPLRYPGGKAKLAKFLKAVLSANNLGDINYVEPYAGGASVGLALLLDEYVSRIHVNDLDRSVYAFWHSVLNDTEALCRRLRDVRLSIAEWRRQRAIQDRGDDASLLDLGFSTFFLNRTNRSGIIRSGGVIGGLEQKGHWKLGARFYRDGLIQRVQAIANYRDRITLHNRDAASLLRTLLPTLPAKSFLYLDPPYYGKANQRLYANSYDHSDHAEIAEILRATQYPWIVSYDDVPQVRKLYKGCPRRTYRLSYTARDRYQGSEIMFFSVNLTLPSISNAVSVTDRKLSHVG